MKGLAEDRAWLDQLKGSAHAKRIPLAAMLELTSRCNLKCQHCYLGPQSEQHKKRALEMSTKQAKQVIDQLVEQGTLTLTITGGDPMMRQDFPAIYRYAREKGLLVTVYCDAILVNDRIEALFREFPPRKVEVSVYGATEETYETVTRVKGSFQKACTGINRLLEMGVHLELKTVLMTLNLDELSMMKEWAATLGVPFRFDAAIFPCLPDNAKEPLDLRVDPERVVQEEMQDPDVRKKWTEKFLRAETAADDGSLYSCAAGGSALYVGPQGHLSPCLMTTHHRFDLKKKPLKDLWENEMQEFRNKKRTKTETGLAGPLRGLCSHCPAFNFLETGDEELDSPYGMELARIRHQHLTQHSDDSKVSS